MPQVDLVMLKRIVAYLKDPNSIFLTYEEIEIMDALGMARITRTDDGNFGPVFVYPALGPIKNDPNDQI